MMCLKQEYFIFMTELCLASAPQRRHVKIFVQRWYRQACTAEKLSISRSKTSGVFACFFLKLSRFQEHHSSLSSTFEQLNTFTSQPCLLLLSVFSLSLQLSPLLPDTSISSLSSQFSQFSVGSLLALGHITALDLREAMSQTRTGIESKSSVDFGDGLH